MVCYCCVKGCNNNSNSAKKDPRAISFHAFPSNSELRQKWLRAIGRPAWNPPSHVRICSAHFSTDKINQDGFRTRIKEDACPVSALPPNSNFEASHIEVCRICLATDVKMFSLEIGVLKNCMETITGFNDNKCHIEGLPQFVCYECARHLTNFYNLMEKSMTTQATLLDIFAENAQITKSLVRKRDRKHLNLQSPLSLNYSMPCHFYEYVYDENETISNLKTKYFSDNNVNFKDLQYCPVNFNEDYKTEIINQTNIEADINFKSEEASIKMDDEDTNLGSSDNDDIDNLSFNEINKTTVINDVKETKELPLVCKKENKKINSPALKTRKKFKGLNGLTADGLDIGRYFNIVKQSEQEQIEEWNKMVAKLSSTSANVFKCEVCLKSFSSTKAYENHVYCHNPKNGASQCPVCKHRFKNDVLMKSHANRAHGKKFHCKSCFKIFNNVSVAKKHHRWHTGHEYSCARCTFKTVHSSALAQHTRTQHEHVHVCTRCGHAFVSARGLALHASTAHRDDKDATTSAEFRCDDCAISFTSEGARRVHLLTSKHHQKNTQGNTIPIDPLLKMTCKQCGVTFPTKKKLVEHSRTEHRRVAKKKTTWKLPGDSYPTQCEHCGCSVNSRKEHWAHVRRTHAALRQQYRAVVTAVCHVCGKGFQNSTKLRIHELRHGSPTFGCETCSRVFHDKYALARHAVAHGPRATHACKHCGRAFALKGNLARHERVSVTLIIISIRSSLELHHGSPHSTVRRVP
ncbi:zinc finger protein 85-like isoform X1 [Ostrinia furnacalis]|uniref:zinc finger protein 85-like isoform X1 n=1 Tax=Ostrinia furnacalis TaxID=93504 RepID=UPI0010391DC9|nr:zinc finger protein 85-like isoform X1 [Ostrinia furnacalis]